MKSQKELGSCDFLLRLTCPEARRGARRHERMKGSTSKSLRNSDSERLKRSQKIFVLTLFEGPSKRKRRSRLQRSSSWLLEPTRHCHRGLTSQRLRESFEGSDQGGDARIRWRVQHQRGLGQQTLGAHEAHDLSLQEGLRDAFDIFSFLNVFRSCSCLYRVHFISVQLS